MISPGTFALAFGAGIVASGVNAVAGGGSLISFPLLTAGADLSSKLANATNSVGLWPGSMSGAFAFIHLFKQTWPKLKRLILPTLLGSQAGAILLLKTPSHVFDVIVPFLILFAVGLLAFQKRIRQGFMDSGRHISPRLGWIIQFMVSVYGGYFGAGMGIMMLAAFSLYVEGTLHDHNAVKNWLGMLINFSITFTFLWKGMVDAQIAVPMILGSLIGGYGAGRVSQKFDPDVLRRWIVAYGMLSAIYFAYAIFHPVHPH